MELVKYILGRLGRSLISLFLVLVIVFLLMRLLPVETYYGDRTDRLTDETKQAILKDLGLDQPIHIQLWNYLKDLAHFDLGESITYYAGKPVWSIMAPKIGYSLRFGAASLAISLVLGISLGILMVRTKGKLPDALGNAFILFINAVPSAVYYLFIQFAGTKLLNIGMLYKEGDISTWILPVISMSLGSIASYAMWTRRYMMDQINSDYVKLARAKGVPNTTIWFRHVFRNSVVPMVNLIPGSILLTISGSIYTESLYSIPGMGGLLVDVIKRQDNSMIVALVVIFAALSIIGLLLGDILMGLVDPRISFAKKEGAR